MTTATEEIGMELPPEARDAYVLFAAGRYLLCAAGKTYVLAQGETIDTLMKIVALRVGTTQAAADEALLPEATVETVVRQASGPAAIVQVDGVRSLLVPFQPPNRPSVQWLSGRFDDGWVATEAVLAATGWREFRLHFYVPMGSDGKPKRLNIVVDGAEVVERTIARESLENILIATRSPEQEIFVQLLTDRAETVGNEDVRQLGFVVMVPEADSAADAQLAADDDTLFQQRLQANLRISAKALRVFEGGAQGLGAREVKPRFAIVADETTLPRARHLQALASRIGPARLVVGDGGDWDDVLSATVREPAANIVLLTSAADGVSATALLLADRHRAGLMLDNGGGPYPPAIQAAAAAAIDAVPNDDRSAPAWLVRDGSAAPDAELAPGLASEFGADVNAARLGLAAAAALKMREDLSPAIERALARILDAALPPISSGASDPSPDGIDVVVFWKQADAGIYGRRVDRIVEYLLRSGHVRRVLRFDAPWHFDEVRRGLLEGKVRPVREEALVARSALARWLGRADTESLRQRIFLWSHENGARFLRKELPPREGFVDFVADELADWGFEPERTAALVFPVVWDFPQVADRFGFARVMVDIVDDQRTWPLGAHAIASLDQAYRETLGRADVVVTNCRPVAEAFGDVSTDISVIPNGVDLPADVAPEPPAALKGRKTPIVGYVGDLRHRIDWPLVAKIVEDHPDWTIVLAGPVDLASPARELKNLPNVVMPGVIPDSEVDAWIGSFSAAFVPHLLTEQTECMNPLKIYRFAGWGLPVVSTPVANIEDVASRVRIESDPAAFSAALDEAVKMPRASREFRDTLIQILGWAARVDAMLALLGKT